jgi:hypothetical protein
MMIIRKTGDGIDTAIQSDNYRGTAISLPPELLENLGIFFWQIEFYLPGGTTVRLPQKPGLWQYDPHGEGGEGLHVFWLQ